jgi:hypothetical protein
VIAGARDQRMLAEQIKTIVDFLSDGRSDEDAEATASPGWRPRDWKPDGGPCSATDCKDTHDHSPHPRHTPRWQSEIDGAIDRWPRYVVVGVPRAINALDATDRLIVRGKTAMGLSFRKVGEMVGRDHKTVRVWYDRALEQIAYQVWDDDGAGRPV